MNSRIKKKYSYTKLTKPLLLSVLRHEQGIRYRGNYKKYIKKYAYQAWSLFHEKYGPNPMIHMVYDGRKISSMTMCSHVEPIGVGNSENMNNGIDMSFSTKPYHTEMQWSEERPITDILKKWKRRYNHDIQ